MYKRLAFEIGASASESSKRPRVERVTRHIVDAIKNGDIDALEKFCLKKYYYVNTGEIYVPSPIKRGVKRVRRTPEFESRDVLKPLAIAVHYNNTGVLNFFLKSKNAHEIFGIGEIEKDYDSDENEIEIDCHSTDSRY